MTQNGPGPDAAFGVPPPSEVPELTAAPQPPPDLWRRPLLVDGSKRSRVLNGVIVGLLVLVVVVTLVIVAASLGTSVFLICGALALVPLCICLLSLYWVDRWEPEPRSALLFAFCWGAGMSVVAALVIGHWVEPLLLAGTSLTDAGTVNAVVRAPLVEETCKGVGVLLIFLLRRRTFDGPIDGIVYAGTVGAGFAFTENILYFGSALATGPHTVGALVLVFVVRGLMSPFAHVMFTATTGVVLGFAARYLSTPLCVLAWAVGLVPAMLLHGLWNSSSLVAANFFAVYGVLQLPIFLVFLGCIVLLRLSESRLTRARLAEYVASGWLTPADVTMLGTARGRQLALAWARRFGGTAAMKTLIQLATRLAFTRQRILVSPASARWAEDEAVLLQQMTGARAELLSRLNR